MSKTNLSASLLIYIFPCHPAIFICSFLVLFINFDLSYIVHSFMFVLANIFTILSISVSFFQTCLELLILLCPPVLFKCFLHAFIALNIRPMITLSRFCIMAFLFIYTWVDYAVLIHEFAKSYSCWSFPICLPSDLVSHHIYSFFACSIYFLRSVCQMFLCCWLFTW